MAFKRSEDIKPFYMKGNGAFAKGEKIPKTKLKLDCPGANSFKDMAQKWVLKKKQWKFASYFFWNRSFVKKWQVHGYFIISAVFAEVEQCARWATWNNLEPSIVDHGVCEGHPAWLG